MPRDTDAVFLAAVAVRQSGASSLCPAVDMRHDRLFLRLEAIATALDLGDDPALVRDMMHSLITEERRHFAEEEALLAAWRYPRLAEHHACHEDILRRCATWCEAAASGASTLAGAAVAISQLLSTHVMSGDRAWKAWLDETGSGGRAE